MSSETNQSRKYLKLSIHDGSSASDPSPLLVHKAIKASPANLRQVVRDAMTRKHPNYAFDVNNDIASIETKTEDGGWMDVEEFLDCDVATILDILLPQGSSMLEAKVVLPSSSPDHPRPNSSSKRKGVESTGKKRKKKKTAKKKSGPNVKEKIKKNKSARKKHEENADDVSVESDMDCSQPDDDGANAETSVDKFCRSEGGNTYQARVLDHSYVGGGKFLVEWSRQEQPASASSSSSLPSSSNTANDATCTVWVKYDEFIVPSAALRYLGSDACRNKRNVPEWEREKCDAELRRKVEVFRDNLARDNALRMEEGEPETLAEVCFCCYLCRCKRKDTRLVQRCESGSKFHRSCCHSLRDEERRVFSSLGKAWDKVDKLMQEGDESQGNPIPVMPLTDLERRTKKDRELQMFLDRRVASARRDESRTEGDYYSRPAQETVRQTDPVAARVSKTFRRICKGRVENPDLLRRAVVLDVFSGIGCGLVALKKLGIDIRRVISVDHDRVAQHVYRWNHDPAYGGNALDDGVEHIFGLYETFEELEKNLEGLVRDYGPIDIILGGPPCQDYSGANANRKGSDGDSGKFMKEFAKVIGKIQKFNRDLYNDDELFFLVENVPNAEKATENYRVSEFKCNAKTFGPCHRERVFYFNWQPSKMPEYDSAVGGSTCFDDGWMMPTMFKHGVDSKALTLLASKARIKDSTLFKWKIKDGMERDVAPEEDRPASHGEVPELFDTNDRERLMGLPENYVFNPVKILFSELRKGFMAGTGNEQWRDIVHPRYWSFLTLGPDGYTFGVDDKVDFGPEKIFLSIKEMNQTSKVCMNDEEYGWHLIGNGFSIPQVMFLLSPLCQLFRKREYDSYTDQKFAWEDAHPAAPSSTSNESVEGAQEQAQIGVKEEERSLSPNALHVSTDPEESSDDDSSPNVK